MDRDSVKWTEVPSDTADFVFEDFVVEPSLELALTSRGRRDFHCRLTTTKDNIVLLSCDGSRVERGISHVCLEDAQVSRRQDL